MPPPTRVLRTSKSQPQALRPQKSSPPPQRRGPCVLPRGAGSSRDPACPTYMQMYACALGWVNLVETNGAKVHMNKYQRKAVGALRRYTRAHIHTHQTRQENAYRWRGTPRITCLKSAPPLYSGGPAREPWLPGHRGHCAPTAARPSPNTHFVRSWGPWNGGPKVLYFPGSTVGL